MSPEQVRGEAIDARSNLFSLGAMFYEMVTDRKAFDREDAESLRQSILESTPVPPMHVNPKLHPVLSDLIMKALAKDPAERYQNGRELLDDLEKCKESKPQAAKQAAAPAKSPAIPEAVKAANQAKFVGTSAAPAVAQARQCARSAAGPPRPSQSSNPRSRSPARQQQPQRDRQAVMRCHPHRSSLTPKPHRPPLPCLRPSSMSQPQKLPESSLRKSPSIP